MYTRAYPPRNMPVPENYSGVALAQEEEEAAPPPNKEDVAEKAQETEAFEETASITPPSQEEPPSPLERGELPFPPSIATSDMLLMAIAALISQNGHADGELIMILLLLLLGE